MRITLFLIFALVASAAGAKSPVYQDTTFAGIFNTWDAATKSEHHVGLTMMEPQKLHFSAIYAAGPVACKTGLLGEIFAMQGMPHVLEQVPITHCIRLATESGRQASVYVQDVLVPGLEHDATVGGQLDVHVDLLGYEVEGDRAKNAPVMLLNRFEPIPQKRA